MAKENDRNTGMKTCSLNRHLVDRLSVLTTGVAEKNDEITSTNKKQAVLTQLAPYLDEVDGFLSFSSSQGSSTSTPPSSTHSVTKGELPVLDWNAHFRKAYTLLLWVRPVMGEERETTILEDDQCARHTRILYRWATAEDDASALGICATIGDWQVIDSTPSVTNTTTTTTTNHTTLSTRRMVHSQLTVYSLPHKAPNLLEPAASNYDSSSLSSAAFMVAPLELEENKWSLIGITHVFPYLKRSHWTLCVNGRVKASAEMPYPVLDKSPLMSFNTLLQDPVTGGCAFFGDTSSSNNKPDYAKKASELQTQVQPRHELKLHVVSFLLSNDAISPTMQALLAQAGPNMSLAKNGDFPVVPPVANWSKGSSLDGPNVGVPLVVHGQALNFQQLAATAILWGSAIEARFLGSYGKQPRIVCAMPPRRGSTHNAPRVGLIQPTPPVEYANQQNPTGDVSQSELISWTITGNVSIHHNLSQFLLTNSGGAGYNIDTQLFSSSKLFSLLLLEGTGLDGHLLLPFFLSLPPPAATMELQMNLLTSSWQHLFDLYSKNASLACQLIHMFSKSIRAGGGRWQEHILQNGSIHVLGSCIRQSLVRAEYLQVDRYSSYTEFVKAKAGKDSQRMKAPMSRLPVSPTKIPVELAHAVAELLDTCCGPPMPFLEDLDPSMQIQRTSDLALTALFGLGMDWELWGQDWASAKIVFDAVASRYGGSCVTAGYILRSQISVQLFLDTLQHALTNKPYSPTNKSSSNSSQQPQDLEDIAESCASILKAMLLSSLSNARSISQAEHDISACLGALSDCPLGSVGAHVIFTAIMGVLQWCDVLPVLAEAGSQQHNQVFASPRIDDTQKSQVAMRMGRNLIVSQFHDVVAPMLLSRTVFSGERTMSMESNSLPLSWEHHWRLGLLIFSWVSTLGGPDGIIAAKSLGSLLLASGLAGSLNGALLQADKALVQHLFLPPPTMAITMAATARKFNEWSYTDLLSDRLAVMMPLLPGLVVSLVSHPSDHHQGITSQGLKILAELLTAVGGSFYRVLGGQRHSAGAVVGTKLTRNREADSIAIQAAKSYIPHLLVVVMVLEHHMVRRLEQDHSNDSVSILQRPSMAQQGADDGSWVEVSSIVTDSMISDGVIQLPESLQDDAAVLLALKACQSSMLTTVSELLVNAMRAGGAHPTTILLRHVLGTFWESALYGIKSTDKGLDKEHDSLMQANVLCRLSAMILTKSLKRDYQWEVWSPELGAGISRLCLLIEERELLMKPLGPPDGKYSKDQVVLLCALLNILQYGRDTTGWCQLILPTPPGPVDEFSQAPSHPLNTVPATSKVLLPVLQPALRCIMESVGSLGSRMQIRIPRPDYSRMKRNGNTAQTAMAEDDDEKCLLDYVVAELKETLMAAIVGLAFANARDVALHALATLRRSVRSYHVASDERGVEICKVLLAAVVEEIRVRYEGERRRRETALFDADAYESTADRMNENARASAVADSHAVEKMILGGDLIPYANWAKDAVEEVTFESTDDVHVLQSGFSEDFVVYNDGLAVGGIGEQNAAKMQWSQYEGLSAALEECSAANKTVGAQTDSSSLVDRTLNILSPFLDAWDGNAAKEAAESELVHLFDVILNSDDRANESERQMALQGSETAADSMSTFIELSAAEKSRINEVVNIFLPNHRYSTMAYTERFCWARYNEIAGDGTMDAIWERGIADGNRDIRSRLVSMPCSPQFRRYIPKYLDHGNANSSREPGTSAQRGGLAATGDDNMDEFTKALLATGHLQIVDITKKEVNVDEQEPDLEIRADDAMDFDEFGETPMEAPAVSDGKSIDSSPTPETASLSDDASSTDLESSSRPEEAFDKTKLGSSHYNITASAFASPPDNSASTLSLMHSAAADLIEKHLENCLHVKAEGSRKCSMLLTFTHLILEYDIDEEGLYEGEMMAVREEAERQRMIDDAGGNSHVREEAVIQDEIEKRQREAASLRPKSVRWNLSELSHVYLRRYRLRDSSLELFFIPSGGASFGGYGLYSPSTSLFVDFGPGYEGNRRRDEAAFAIMKRAPPQAIKQWPDRSGQFLHEQISRLTMGWVEGRITNFDYLLHLNMLAGRSYNDTCQYPVMPWVLANYKDEEIPDLCDRNNYRDLTKPVGALNPGRLKDFIERFSTFADPSIPPFMYGSHYSTNAGVVLHFLVRLHPFAGLHRQLQGGHFDVADRLFSSIPRTWDMCTGSSAAEVKELTPEWYCNPAFLKNTNKFKLGTSQDGEVLGDVALPPWAKGSPEIFVEVMRNALESDICSSMLPDWIDLIFGKKQQGPAAIEANNVFFYLTYYGSVDVNAIEDEGLRQATELQIAHFGQCPMQIFMRPHVRRFPRVNRGRMSFYQVTSTYTYGVTKETDVEKDTKSEQEVTKKPIFGQPLYLPFFSAPMSHWVHLDAPPPGPHASLLSVRLAGTDRCLAVDARGVFHCFRWAWKPDEPLEIEGTQSSEKFSLDGGCFIAQRELPRFRTVPRLPYVPRSGELPVVAISKTLFAGRSVLLVLSDGDGRGGFAMQLVDPAKGSIRGEALVESIHTAQLTCIASDPIGTAAGHGGVGGELVLVGSLDGYASIWRFMSSHYLPLRPRLRLSGHAGAPIVAVGLSAAINIAATVSETRLCLHSLGNGNLIRVIQPPQNFLDLPDGSEMTTTFAKSPAVALSVQGFVVTVCETQIKSTVPSQSRSVVTLHLYSLEGVSLGSKPLESWRGAPHKMSCTPDGTAVLVCSGRGVTIHRLSAITPLEFIDEWHITETDELNSSVSRAWDIDLGPSLNLPVVAAAACSNGSLRLHALPGISAFSERHRKLGIGQSVGSVLAAPARRLKDAVGKGWGVGSKVAGVGKDIGKEIKSDLQEKGVGGLIGNMFRKKGTGK